MEEKIIKDINNLLAQLFQKMKEAGYEWNADKKVLVMIGIDNDDEDERYEELEDDETDLSIEPINEYNTHEPTLEEAKEWNEAYEKGYSLGYENGKNEQKLAWGEDDEKMLKWLCRIVHSQRVNNVITVKEESELGQWMDKWLNHNPQSHWKPTEEQMEALLDCVSLSTKENFFKLNSLYEQLIKL